MLYGLEVLSGLTELEKSDILNDKVIHMSQKGGYNIFCKELIKNILSWNNLILDLDINL